MLVTRLDFSTGPVYVWTCDRCRRRLVGRSLDRVHRQERTHEARSHRWGNTLDGRRPPHAVADYPTVL